MCQEGCGFPRPPNILMVMQINKGIRTTLFGSEKMDSSLTDVHVSISMLGFPSVPGVFLVNSVFEHGMRIVEFV